MSKKFPAKVSLSMVKLELEPGKATRGVVVNVTPDEQAQAFEVSRLHQVHVVDRSGSMWPHNAALAAEVRKTISLMEPDDLLTVIWFSGAGQGGVVCQGSRAGEPGLGEVVEKSLLNVVGLTCFSEALASLPDILERYAPMAADVVVTLFTDGEAVVPWSRETEATRCAEAIAKASVRPGVRLHAVNTVGYGQYYDEAFLRSLSALTAQGKTFHSSKIDEYSGVWSRSFEDLRGSLALPGSVEGPAGSRALYLTRSSSSFSHHPKLEVQALNKTKNQFVVLLPENEGGYAIKVSAGGEEAVFAGPVIALKRATAATDMNVSYALAYELHLRGELSSSLQLLAAAGDKPLIDSHTSALTRDEVGAHRAALARAAYKGARAIGSAPKDYVPAPGALSVVKILSALGACAGPNVRAAIPEDYKKIGRSVVDGERRFTRDVHIHGHKLNDITFNDKRLNISIMLEHTGKVTINPASAARVGLEPSVETREYRNYAVVQDGKLNVEKLDLFVLQGSEEEKEIYGMLDLAPPERAPLTVNGEENWNSLTVDLTAYPMCSRSAERDAAELQALAYASETHAAHAKVLGWALQREGGATPAALKEARGGWTAEQSLVLQEHGLNPATMAYSAVARGYAGEEYDTYRARKVEVDLAGFSSLPSVKDVLERIEKDAAAATAGKKAKEMPPALRLMAGIIDELRALHAGGKYPDVVGGKLKKEEYKQVREDRANHVRARRAVMAEIAETRIACWLSGQGVKGLPDPDEKGHQRYKGDGKLPELVVKVGYDEVRVDVPAPAKREETAPA